MKKANIKKIALMLILLTFIFFVFMYVRVVAHSNGVWHNATAIEGTKTVTAENSDIVLEFNYISSVDQIRGIIFGASYIQMPKAESITVSLIDQDNVLGTATIAKGNFVGGEQMIFDLINIVPDLQDKELKIRVLFQGVPEIQESVDYLNSQIPPSMVIASGRDAFCVAIDVSFALLFLIVIAIFTAILLNKKFSIETIYLIAVLGLGFIMTILITLMVVPDEPTHLYMAYEISNDLLGIDASENGTLMMRYDDAVTQYVSIETSRVYFNSYFGDFFKGISNSQLIDTGITPANSPIYLHLFSGVGITLGRLLGLGTTLTFMLGRWFNLLVFALVSYYAIRKIPFGKAVVFVWGLLPIMLQQVGSYSYDCIVNTLSILVIAMTMYFMYGERPKSKRKLILEIGILVVAVLLLIPCKSHALLPIALLPFMILVKLVWDKRDKIKAYLKEKKYRRNVCVAVVALVAVVGLVVAAIALKSILANADGNGAYITWSHSYARPVGYYIKHPVDLISLFINTIWAKGEDFFVEMIGGSLGWQKINIPIIFVVPFFVLLFYAAVRRENETQQISVVSKVWMWIVFLGICFLACLGMLLYWTIPASTIIQGVQGRYFLPALVLPFLASRTTTAQVSKNADKIIVYSVIILYVFIITSLIKRSL